MHNTQRDCCSIWCSWYDTIKHVLFTLLDSITSLEKNEKHGLTVLTNVFDGAESESEVKTMAQVLLHGALAALTQPW